MDPINGLGLTQHSRSITTYKAFFITLTLPHSMKRGEILTIPVVINNNMKSDLDTDVTINNEEQYFEFVEMNNEMGDNPSKYGHFTFTNKPSKNLYFFALQCCPLQKSSSIAAKKYLCHRMVWPPRHS